MTAKTLPLATRSSVDLLLMGAPVHVHHRAGIARWRKAHKEWTGEHGWVIVEGALKGEYINDSCGAQLDFSLSGITTEDHLPPTRRFSFYTWKRAKHPWGQEYNKTVMIWPVDTHGWVIGIMRKAIGISESSRGYYDSWSGESDYDPGGCAVDMFVDLYIIKLAFDRSDTILCPLWGVIAE